MNLMKLCFRRIINVARANLINLQGRNIAQLAIIVLRDLTIIAFGLINVLVGKIIVGFYYFFFSI